LNVCAAIVLEQNVSDIETLPAAARSLWPEYHLTVTPCTKTMNLIHPDAAFLAPKGKEFQLA
jgi:hypothetical protein